MIFMTIGQKIKEYRESKKMSQSALAKALNVSRQAVNLWERNRAVPRITKLLILKNIFGCDINDILVNTNNVILVK